MVSLRTLRFFVLFASKNITRVRSNRKMLMIISAVVENAALLREINKHNEFNKVSLFLNAKPSTLNNINYVVKKKLTF